MDDLLTLTVFLYRTCRKIRMGGQQPVVHCCKRDEFTSGVREQGGCLSFIWQSPLLRSSFVLSECQSKWHVITQSLPQSIGSNFLCKIDNLLYENRPSLLSAVLFCKHNWIHCCYAHKGDLSQKVYVSAKLWGQKVRKLGEFALLFQVLRT